MEGANRSTSHVNVALAAALALLTLGGAVVLWGPGRQRIQRSESALRERLERAESWARERAAFRAPSASERHAWRTRWEELLARVEIVEGDPALIAHVAEQFQAPSVRQLEVAQARTDLGTPERVAEATTLEAPDADERVALVSVPLAVSLNASYEDALALLERIESRRIPARLDSLDMERRQPGVAMRLGLAWFTRNPQADAR